MKKTAMALTSVLAVGSLLAGCSSADENSEKRGQVLNITEKGEIPSMDTAIATDSISFSVFTNTNEGLYRLDENNKPVPGVAESYKLSDDQKTYTFTLRESKWSNGEPVTAHDFVYAWQRVVTPEVGSQYSFILGGIKNANAIINGEAEPSTLGVKAVDDYTLEVQLDNPIPYFLELTTFGTYMPVNEKFAVEQGKEYGLEFDSVLYNGPFVMSEWKHKQSYTLTKNKDYWDADTVKLDTINVKIVEETSTAVNLYQAGDIDRALLDSESVDQFKNSEEFKTYLDPRINFIRFNQTNEIFKNENVRKAFSLAYDKEGITDVILNDGSEPAFGFVPAGFVTGPDGKDYRDKYGDLMVTNLDQAKEYWAKAKQELGVDTVEVEMLNYNDASHPKIGEYMKEQLESNLEGLTVTIKEMPFKQKLDLETKMEYDFSLSGWGPDYPDPMTYIDMFVTTSPFNEMAYSDEKYDSLVAASNGDLLYDLPARWEALQDAEKILVEEDAAISPMYQKGISVVQKSYVKGIVKHNFGGDYSYKWAYIEE